MTGGLFIYHTQLIRNNLTTNEHQNMFKYDYLKSIDDDGNLIIKNPFDKGFIRNLISRFAPSRDTYVMGCTSIDSHSCQNDSCSDHHCDKGLESMSSSKNKKIDGDEDGEKVELVANMV